MKELTIEQKAKAYDEALENMRKFRDALSNHEETDLWVLKKEIVTDIEYYFPELAESEDERTRKDIKQHFLYLDDSFPDKAKWLAWLEKQGEHANFLSKIQVGDKVTRNEGGVLVNISQLNRVAKKRKKQGEQNLIMAKSPQLGEQKPTDKDESVINILNKENQQVQQEDLIMKPSLSTKWSKEDENEVAVLEAYIRSNDWSERHIDRALGIVDELVNKCKSSKDKNTATTKTRVE